MTANIDLQPTCCPLCGLDSCSFFLKGTDQFYDVPGEFQIVRCSGCRHLYMNPRPTDESIPHCYPSGYAPHHAPSAPEKSESQVNAPERTPWYLTRWGRAIPGLRRLYYWLTETNGVFIPDLPSVEARALELGCAAGQFLEVLRSRGWTACGVELVAEPAAEARRRGFDVYTGTLEQARLPDEKFDATFAFNVIEHLADPLGTIRELHRVTKPGGWFIFSIPNAGSWEARVFGRYWADYELPRHLQHFTVKSIRQCLKQAGFDDVKVIHQRTIQGVIGSIGVAWSELFPRSRSGQTVRRWYRENPPLWIYLMTAAAIKPLVALFGSGRLTIVARKPARPSSGVIDPS